MTNYLLKVLITGGNGQLAQALQQHAFAKNFQLYFCSRTEMDISDLQAVANVIQQFSPDIVINTAAYTAVDKAESDVETVMQANHLGAKNLAIVCHQASLPLIHLSTDYVFNGEKQTPYHEDDVVKPINIYGESKWLGEQAVREYCKRHFILRVSGVFSEFGNNFFKTMLRLAEERKELRVVADQTICPTDANDIARVLLTMIPSCINQDAYGTYHYCSGSPISWHQFATDIIAEAKKYKSLAVEKILAITTQEYPTPAKRPMYSVLACEKIKTHFGISQTALATSIQQVAAALLQRA